MGSVGWAIHNPILDVVHKMYDEGIGFNLMKLPTLGTKDLPLEPELKYTFRTNRTRTGNFEACVRILCPEP